MQVAGAVIGVCQWRAQLNLQVDVGVCQAVLMQTRHQNLPGKCRWATDRQPLLALRRTLMHRDRHQLRQHRLDLLQVDLPLRRQNQRAMLSVEQRQTE
ncbi:hypothetical protein D3C80_1486600 [compost metagenome]